MRSREALPLGCFSCGNVWSGQVFAYLHGGAALGSDSGVTGDSLCGLKGAVIFQKIRDAGSPAYLRRRFSMSAASVGTRVGATSSPSFTRPPDPPALGGELSKTLVKKLMAYHNVRPPMNSKKAALRFSKTVLDSFFSFLPLRYGYREFDAEGRTSRNADRIRPSVDPRPESGNAAGRAQQRRMQAHFHGQTQRRAA